MWPPRKGNAMATWALPTVDEIPDCAEFVKVLEKFKTDIYYTIGDDELFNALDDAIDRIKAITDCVLDHHK